MGRAQLARLTPQYAPSPTSQTLLASRADECGLIVIARRRRPTTAAGTAASCGAVLLGVGERGRAMSSTMTSSVFSAHPPVRPDWLAKRREAALEPDLPIVDPHHHLIDRPENGTYLLRDMLADIDSGHNVVATVYLEWLSMYRADGPVEMRPVGEIEFANGIGAMSASGTYGKPR